MNKEFVNYNTALALKELGFDEVCLAMYTIAGLDLFSQRGYAIPKGGYTNTELSQDSVIGAPLYQQAFTWLHEQLGFKSSCMPLDVEHREAVLNNNIKSLKEKYGNT